METHREIRRELLGRYRRLVRRLRGLHGDLDGYGRGEEQEVASAVGEIIEAATHELGLIRAAFERMPPMPIATTDRLCRLVLTGMLPAAYAGDSRAFGDAMSQYGRLVGEYFAPEQGGVYSHPRAPAIIERLRAAGVHGIAQTSWGPTLCALLHDESTAEALSKSLSTDAIAGPATIRIAHPLNRAATIRNEAT